MTSTASTWKETTLGEVAVVDWGNTNLTKRVYDPAGKYLGVSAAGCDGRLHHAEHVVGTTVISAIGEYAGRVYYPREEFTAIKNTITVKGKEGVVDDDYLYYLLVKNRIPRRGAAQPFLSKGDTVAYPINLPPLDMQRAIAALPASLDRKIELLKQQNFTFEEAARLLFRDWFATHATEGSVPLGWQVMGLSEIATFLNGIALQKYPTVDGEEVLPAIKIRELRAGITETTGKASAKIPQKYIIEDGDILFSWSGTLEVVLWKYGKGALNQHLFKVIPEHYPKWFVYLWLLEYLEEFRIIAASKATTMGHIQRHHLDDAKVVVPDKDTLEKANVLFAPIFEKLVLNNSEAQTLVALRDTILPKIMGGELQIKS